jgi:hypothetical protein
MASATRFNNTVDWIIPTVLRLQAPSGILKRSQQGLNVQIHLNGNGNLTFKIGCCPPCPSAGAPGI